MNARKVFKYVFIFLLILGFTLICSPLNLDEVWNYGFANNLYKNLVPYKDFNMVLTPFYPFLMSLPFYIFGSNILVIHITNALLLVGCYYILEKMLGNKSSIILLFMFFPCCTVFPNYNSFLFLLLVLLIYLEKFRKNDYLIGLLLGIGILTKQTVGLCLLLPSLFYIKRKKILLKRLIGISIPLIIFTAYLIVFDCFYEFIDLCFLGLFDFTGNNKGINLLLFFGISLVIATINFLMKDRKNISNYYVLSFYSIMIPIVDIYHFMYAFWAFLLLLLPKINKRIVNYEMFSFASIIALGVFNFYYNVGDGKIIYPNDLEHFEYRMISEANYKFTWDVNRFLITNKNKKIIFLNANSYYFRIINNEECGYLDLINRGNWGFNGSNKLLREIMKNKKAIFLVDKKELDKRNQSDFKALKYIVDNGKMIERIGVYSVYVLEQVNYEIYKE